MEGKEIAAVLEEAAVLMELAGENPFKVRAYHNAARMLLGLTVPVEKAIESGELGAMKGIGKGMLETIGEIADTGALGAVDELKAKVPSGLLELLKVQGLGVKRVKTLYEQLGISGPGELEYACLENRLVELPGFGSKMQESILEGLEFLRRTRDRRRLPVAFQHVRMLLPMLQDDPQVMWAEVTGSVRRHCETVGDLDLLASADPTNYDAIMDKFVAAMPNGTVEVRSNDTVTVRSELGLKVQLILCTPSQFGMALVQTTGSKDHLKLLEELAISKGMEIDGFYLMQNLTALNVTGEETVYEVLGLHWIPPELREGHAEVALAQKDALPDLVTLDDVQGILHVHTTYSDGHHTLRQFAEAVMGRGWTYLGIADHSQAAAYAGGLTPEEIQEQQREIHRMNARLAPFKVFAGIEADVLIDGSLDYDDEILRSFDFVIASVHNKLRMDKQEATTRILKALDNPHVRILGHPTGRLLLAREGYELDMERVLDKCAEKDIAVELNAHPYRLDLDWRYHALARERGVKIAINPDAHQMDGLDDVSYGVGIARKGGCEAKHVLNCLSATEIADFFAG